MYRKAPPKSPTLILVMVLFGVVAGIVFVLNDQRPPTTVVPTVPIASPTVPPPIQATPTLMTVEDVAIFIPGAGVSAHVVHIPLDSSGSWDVTVLGHNVGHLQGTAWLDKPGNVGLAGHVEMADGSAGVFARLRDLSAGDAVYLTLPEGSQRLYSIESVRSVAPDYLNVLYPTPEDRLTLITCGSYNFTTLTYEERIVASAIRIE